MPCTIVPSILQMNYNYMPILTVNMNNMINVSNRKVDKLEDAKGVISKQ